MQISFDNGDRERAGVEYLWYVWERIRLLAASGDVPRKETLRKAYKNAYEGYNHKSHLGHFFRNLYHVFRFVEDAEVLDDVEKERYAKLVRAQLSTPETAFLFMNGLHDTGRRFRRLIEKYALLQELQPADLPMDNFSKEDMLECYKPAAFFDREDMPAGVASENDGK